MSETGATLLPPRSAVATKPEGAPAKPKHAPAWNVVLLDDDDHGYNYVVAMLRRLFGHTEEHAYRIATRVDTEGRAVCFTTHKELAELKCEQITGFGADRAIAHCAGSMSALIEPAFGEEDTGPD